MCVCVRLCVLQHGWIDTASTLFLQMLKLAEKLIIYFDPKKRFAERKVLAEVTAFIRCRFRDNTVLKVTALTDIVPYKETATTVECSHVL